MINGKKVLALIPARSGSKGLPGKNIKELCGKPLIGWPIEAAKGSHFVDKVIVSTDSDVIRQISLKLGAEVPFLRPAKLASDEAKSADVIVHSLDYFSRVGNVFDYVVFLEPTSPLTESYDIDKALEILETKRQIADSIVGVSKIEAIHPIFCVSIDKYGLLESITTNGFKLAGRRQELDKLYFFDGSLYISDTSAFLKEKSFYHSRTLPYIVPRWKSFEVDSLLDFYCIETILKNKEELRKEAD